MSAPTPPPVQLPGPRPAPGPSTESKPPAQGGDTLRGVIAVVGTDRDNHVVIRTSAGTTVTLLGPEAKLAGRAAGADVWVSGAQSDRTFTVQTFAVRTVDGIAATDGELTAEGTRLVLVTADGKRHPIANAPDALRAHVGGRVWLSGNLDQGPVAFGVIKPKP